jgi:iron complex transport system ATP-binding protein
MTTTLLEARGLSAGYGPRPVVVDVDFVIRAGELAAIVGPNAAGKSTLLHALAGALPASRGEVLLGGASIRSLPARERARRLALVPQSARWDVGFTVREMVALGRSPRAGAWSLESPEDRAAIERALADADVAHLSARTFAELSGGERQRVLFARSLAQAAPLVLLDEPTAHLDLGHQQLVLERMHAQARAGGAAVLVLHDLSLAARADRVVVLDRGRVVADGPPLEVLTAARLAATWNVTGALVGGAQGPALVVSGRTR